MDINEYIRNSEKICYLCKNSIDKVSIPCPLFFEPKKLTKTINSNKFIYNVCDIDNKINKDIHTLYFCENIFHIDCCKEFIINNQDNIKYINSLKLYFNLLNDMEMVNNFKLRM
jgi:hypothetical protein